MDDDNKRDPLEDARRQAIFEEVLARNAELEAKDDRKRKEDAAEAKEAMAKRREQQASKGSALDRLKSADHGTTPTAEPAFFDPNDLTRVPGAVGQFIDWVEQSAIYPSRRLALGAALATVGTLISHRVMGPTGGGTHLYIVELAATGEGKGAPMKAATTALESIGAGHLIGPGDFRSSVGLIHALKVKPVFLSLMDEYGDFLQRIAHPSAGNYETDTINVIKQVFALSYSAYHSPVAAHEKSVRIFAPALSIVGFSTIEQFYTALQDKQISGGFLNRHLIIDAQQHTEFNPSFTPVWKLPPALRQAFGALYRPREAVKDLLKLEPDEISDIVATTFEPEIMMTWGPDAEAQFIELAQSIKKESDLLRRNLFIRVAEITVRTASIIAFGRRSQSVDALDMALAKALVLESTETLYAGVRKYTRDLQDFAGLCQRVEDMLKASPGKTVTMRDIKRKFTTQIKRGTDIEQVMQHLEGCAWVKRSWNAPEGSGRHSEVVEWIGD
jgi:hypothetical protein